MCQRGPSSSPSCFDAIYSLSRNCKSYQTVSNYMK